MANGEAANLSRLVSTLPLQQLFEPRMTLEGREVGVDRKPCGRKVIGDLEQRLEPVERLLALSEDHEDAHELVLNYIDCEWPLPSMLPVEFLVYFYENETLSTLFWQMVDATHVSVSTYDIPKGYVGGIVAGLRS